MRVDRIENEPIFHPIKVRITFHSQKKLSDCIKALYMSKNTACIAMRNCLEKLKP